MSNYAPAAGPLAPKTAGTFVCDTMTVNGATTVTGALTVDGALTAPSFSGLPGPAHLISSAAVGATINLTAAQSGSLLVNKSTSGSPAFVLPAAAVGLRYGYLCTSTSEACVFTCADAAVINGRTGGTSSSTGPGAAIASTASTGNITHTQATAVLGDSFVLQCDGTNWFIMAQIGILAAT